MQNDHLDMGINKTRKMEQNFEIYGKAVSSVSVPGTDNKRDKNRKVNKGLLHPGQQIEIIFRLSFLARNETFVTKAEPFRLLVLASNMNVQKRFPTRSKNESRNVLHYKEYKSKRSSNSVSDKECNPKCFTFRSWLGPKVEALPTK